MQNKQDNPTYRLMKKFKVSVTLERGLTVWGDDEKTVQQGMQDTDWNDLFESEDVEVYVAEDPDLKANMVEDGVVTAEGWVNEVDFKAPDDETLLTPTDDPSLVPPPEPGSREFQQRAERRGQIRLFKDKDK